MEKIVCHDCGQELGENDEVMRYDVKGAAYYKCKSCHAVDPVLRNFQASEVYSRVVGYIRPVEQWNSGKKEEFSDRLEFSVADNACC